MKDDKNDNSIDKKIKSITKVTNMGSIDSISEKNEESSHSTIKVQKLKATKKLQRSVIGESSKAVNRLNASIRKVKRQTLENYTDKKFKQFKRKESKKKMDDLSKRISFQQNNTFNFLLLKYFLFTKLSDLDTFTLFFEERSTLGLL